MFEGSNMIEKSCAPQSKYTVHACSCPYSSNQHVEIQNPYSQGKTDELCIISIRFGLLVRYMPD